MALHNLKTACKRRLRERGALANTVDRWGRAFEAATATGEPFLCPSCFILELVGRLLPLPQRSPGSSAVMCTACRQVIEYADA